MAAAKKTKSSAAKAPAEKIYDSFIVGAGISGIAAAIKLKKEGYNNFKIIGERTEWGAPGGKIPTPAVVVMFRHRCIPIHLR